MVLYNKRKELTADLNIRKVLFEKSQRYYYEHEIYEGDGGTSLILKENCSFQKKEIGRNMRIGSAFCTHECVNNKEFNSEKHYIVCDKIRLKNNMFGGGVIGDSKQVLILLGESKNGNLNNLNINYDLIAIWAEHTGLSSFAKDYFQYLWKDAQEIDNR